MNPLITFKHVSKWFGQFCVLNDINFDIYPSKKIVVCGPSGSGKSTFIRCINALETYQKGEIVVNNLSLNEQKNILRIRNSVGMVFQQFNLFPHLTILENLTLAPIQVKKMKAQEAKDLAFHYLELVKIPEQAAKYPAQLSGGQQQRAAIARSLCMQPSIMLFDEPTSALDPEMIHEVLDVIMMLAEKGMTMVCVTHEMSFARRLADVIVFMSEGKIIESNEPEQFFANPKEERTRQFLSQIQQYA